MKNLKKEIKRNNRKHRTGEASNLNKDSIFWLPRKARERGSMFIHQFWFIFGFGNWQERKGELLRESARAKISRMKEIERDWSVGTVSFLLSVITEIPFPTVSVFADSASAL